jgi:NADH-quinone oxidoreductase subunit H
MGDPLFADGVDGVDLIIVAIKAVFVFALLLLSVLLMIWIERKVVADMQNRIGPNRAGPFGVLQSLADGIKLFFKEQSIPDSADRAVFRLAPYLSVLPAFLAFSVIPLSGEFTVPFTDRTTILQLADPPIGVLFVLAMSGLGVYGVLLAGWSSGSKYPLLGSVRASAQMVSYEAALGLGILGAVLQAGSLSTAVIVAGQGYPHSPPWEWFVVPAFVSFFIFCVAAVAETNRAPFDLVEAEQELVGGFHTEYTGIRFAIFFLAEYMNMVTQSAIAVTLFLGGPTGPFDIPGIPTVFEGILWFLLKISVFLFGYIWLRAALPRLRYDQLMDLGWRVLIPVGLIFLGASATFQVARQQGWSPLVYFPAVLLGASAVGGFLYLCMPTRAAFRRAPAEDEAIK